MVYTSRSSQEARGGAGVVVRRAERRLAGSTELTGAEVDVKDEREEL